MEKILKKSKSRYFFGKKKSAKDQGISNTDVPASKARSESFGGLPTQVNLPYATPRMFPGGASVLMLGGAGTHHPRPLPTTPDRGNFQTHSRDNLVRPFDPGTSSQSRFEVHISPTAFSPIVMPSSTPPHSSFSPVSSSPSRQKEKPPSNPGHSTETPVGHARQKESPSHAHAQASASSDHRSKQRRHGIPANFMDMGGGMHEKNNWNGKSLGAERYMNSQSGPVSSSDSDPFVQPSASAPAASCLSDAIKHASSDLAPLLQSATDPAISSPNSLPLPRSNPSYNLAALTPSSSSVAPTQGSADGDPLPSPKSNRGTTSSEMARRPYRDPPAQPPPESPVPKREASSMTSHYHTPSSSVTSEIGYKGLAFPLPPSSEEGLVISFSSSQSSLFSVASGRTPLTPKKLRESTEDKTSKTSGSRGAGNVSGRGTREKSTSVSEGRSSPPPIVGALRRHREYKYLEQGPLGTNSSGTDTEGERETIRNVQERVAKELEEQLGIPVDEKEFTRNIVHSATSDSTRAPPALVRPQPQPSKTSESTKPLSFTPGRKTLHTARSMSTGLGERQQLHTSASQRDLSASFQGVNARGERVRATTVIPMRVDTQRDVPGSSPNSPSRSEAQQQIPPSFPLPTPPNSSSTLSFLAGEAKNSGNAQSRPRGERLPVGPGTRPTLEDVTNALRTQRGRFDELAGYVLDVAQRHAVEKDGYEERVGKLEGAVAKMEREIQGLRWLVLESTKAREGGGTQGADGGGKGDDEKDGGAERRLRRSSTMPHLPKFSPIIPGPTRAHARSKRDAIGLGLGFSPDSALSSSPSTLASTGTRHHLSTGPLDEMGERTPSMDDIIDRLMAVRQWKGADVRVSIVESTGTGADGGDSKRIIFREG